MADLAAIRQDLDAGDPAAWLAGLGISPGFLGWPNHRSASRRMDQPRLLGSSASLLDGPEPQRWRAPPQCQRSTNPPLHGLDTAPGTGTWIRGGHVGAPPEGHRHRANPIPATGCELGRLLLWS